MFENDEDLSKNLSKGKGEEINNYKKQVERMKTQQSMA